MPALVRLLQSGALLPRIETDSSPSHGALLVDLSHDSLSHGTLNSSQRLHFIHLLPSCVVWILEAVGEIQHIQPPSSGAWVLAALVCLTAALVLLAFEIYQVDWGRVLRRAKGMPSDGAHPSDAPAGARAEQNADGSKQEAATDNRWCIFALLVLIFAGSDLYDGVTSAFLPGLVQALGLSIGYAGIYSAAAPLVAFLVAPVASTLLGWIDAAEIQRIAIAFLAVVSIPQALSSNLGSAGGFVALMTSLRVLEGLVMGITESVAFAIILRVFPAREVGTVMGFITALRGGLSAGSPVVGGLLYDLSGVAAPFTIVGSFNILSVLCIRMCKATFDMPPLSKPTAPIRDLLRIWRLSVTLLGQLLIFMIPCSVGIMAQPWLGVEPLNLTPSKIAFVIFVLSGSTFLSASLLGTTVIRYVGPAWCSFIGQVLVLVGVALIGCHTVLLPHLTTAAATLNVAYFCMVAIGVGFGMTLPAGLCLLLLCIFDAGLTQKQTSVSLGTVAGMLPFLAAAVGPSFSSFAVASLGVSTTAMLLAATTCVALLLNALAFGKFVGRDMPDELEEE